MTNIPVKPICEGQTPPSHPLEPRYINVNGRQEHEAVIKDSAKCKELGIDQMYETMVYLSRWGGWLNDINN